MTRYFFWLALLAAAGCEDAPSPLAAVRARHAEEVTQQHMRELQEQQLAAKKEAEAVERHKAEIAAIPVKQRAEKILALLADNSRPLAPRVEEAQKYATGADFLSSKNLPVVTKAEAALEKREKQLAAQEAALRNRVAGEERSQVAASLEDAWLHEGIECTVRAGGSARDILRIESWICSRTFLIRKFEHQLDVLKAAGWKKIVCSNSLETSSWNLE